MPVARAFPLHLRGDVAGVGHLFHRRLVTIIAPRVEGAFQQIAMHLAAMAHMRAQMLAIGVQHANLAVLTPPDRQILGEIAQRLHLADLQLRRQQDRIPAKGNADIEVTLLDRRAILHLGEPPVEQILPFQLFQYLPDGNRRGTRISGSAGLGVGHGKAPSDYFKDQRP